MLTHSRSRVTFVSILNHGAGLERVVKNVSQPHSLQEWFPVSIAKQAWRFPRQARKGSGKIKLLVHAGVRTLKLQHVESRYTRYSIPAPFFCVSWQSRPVLSCLILQVSRSHNYTHAHTPSRAPPKEWSVRRRGRYVHNAKKHTQKTSIHVIKGYFIFEVLCLFCLCSSSVLFCLDCPGVFLCLYFKTHNKNVHATMGFLLFPCTPFVLHPYVCLCLDCPAVCLLPCTYNTQHKHPCPRRDMSPGSQQVNGRMPET
jgi:hypothetical protein